MMHMPHPSCYEFDLGDGTAVLSTRSVDVNKWIGLGTPVLIANTCALSVDTRFVITNQPTSLDSSLTKGKDAPVFDVLFRVFDLQSGAPVNGFDPLSDRNRIAKQCNLHPSQPWAVTVASGIALPSSEVSLWNFNSGELLARVNGPAFLRDPAISPDGERIAFWASNGVIPIYRFQSN
jgi:hypothetical protein